MMTYQVLPVFGLHGFRDFAHLDEAAKPPGLKKVDAPPPLPTRPGNGRQARVMAVNVRRVRELIMMVQSMTAGPTI
jgi:hypothetical protein